MKKIVTVFVALSTVLTGGVSIAEVKATSALPGKAQSVSAVAAFNSSLLIAAKLEKLDAVKVGTPKVIRLSGMGDGCEYMETYLVIQHIFNEELVMTQSAISAKVDISTTDLDCSTDGQKKGKEISVSSVIIHDLK